MEQSDVKVKMTKKELQAEQDKQHGDELLYGVNETPPLHISFFYALQMILTNLDGTIIMVYLIFSNICAENDPGLFAKLMSTAIFVGGLCTLMEVSFGVRLPVYQGSTKAFLAPLLALMATEAWKCPDPTLDPDAEPWRSRMQEISGALILCSVIQVFLGLTGIMGWLMNYIGPMTITPAITFIGLAMFRSAAKACHYQWGIAMMTAILSFIFPLVLGKVKIPVPGWNRRDGFHTAKYPLFKIYPQILAIGLAWILCGILTATDVFKDDPDLAAYKARTDIKLDNVHEAAWFYFPYPFQWGWPKLSVGVVGGMMTAVMSSILDSMGDYIACARACKLPVPPPHAVNRGIAVEGLATIVSGVCGAAHGTSTIARGIGLIGLTGVASRSVMQIVGFLLMILAVIGKFGAVFTIIPDPIIGGMAISAGSIIIGVALSNLEYVKLSASRNQITLGAAIFLGLTVPHYMRNNQDAIQTGNTEANDVIKIILSTEMLVAAVVGFIMDNTLPGSKEMRGIKQLKKDLALEDEMGKEGFEQYKKDLEVYDLPCMGFHRRHKVLEYVPVCPTYDPQNLCSCCRKRSHDDEEAPSYRPQEDSKSNGGVLNAAF